MFLMQSTAGNLSVHPVRYRGYPVVGSFKLSVIGAAAVEWNTLRYSSSPPPPSLKQVQGCEVQLGILPITSPSILPAFMLFMLFIFIPINSLQIDFSKISRVYANNLPFQGNGVDDDNNDNNTP